jgi:Shikimate kinase
MMGSGKSTIGKALSERLNMKFADTDTIIESKLSLPISEIFEVKGEKFFRKLEMEESIKLTEKKGFVIALGGGAFINDQIREKIKKSCFSVYLQLNINELFERTKNNQKRPLLNTNESKKELKKLYEKRKEFYSMADYKVDCDSKTKN